MSRSAEEEKAERFQRWCKWLPRVMLAILTPLLLFGLVEGGLRVGGYGYPTGFFLESDTHGFCTTNPRFGWRFFPRALARDPDPCSLSAKPDGAIRIFVLGSSAAMGTPDPSFNFGRILAVMLRERYPERQFEVINGAMVAINSHVVREIARDCAAHEPDLFVVYTGNNEVIGPFGPGTVFQRWSPSLWVIHAGLWVKSTRVGQLLGDVMARFHGKGNEPSSWRGMEMFTRNPVTADDSRLAAVVDNFRRNLTDICGIARRAHAPVVLLTVPVNVRDCPPFASLHRPDITPDDLVKWNSAYESGVGLEASNDWHEAILQYEAAVKIDDRFAELQFRMGECLMKDGRVAEAQHCFALALELDVLRFRADSRIDAVIREVAAAQEAAGVRLVDGRRILAQAGANTGRTSGGDLFYEHVHLTFAGNYILARGIFDAVCAALPQLGELSGQGTIPARQRCAEWLAFTPWDEYQMADIMVNMTSRPPFTNQINHRLRQAEAGRHRDVLRELATKPEATRAAWSTYESVLARSPDDWNVRHHLGRFAMQLGRFDEAIEQLQMTAARVPLDSQVYNDLGVALTGRGLRIEAIAQFRKALELRPDFIEAHNNLGLALAGCGKVLEAVGHYRRALDLDPENVQAHVNLGDALASLGQGDEAIVQYRKTLDLDPANAQACNNLGLILAGCGQIDEALLHYRKALEIKPDYADAHNNLGLALAGARKGDEAITHYQKALALKPDYAEAHNNLGVALMFTHGQVDEAIVHFRKALEIKPGYQGARQNLERALAGRGRSDDVGLPHRKPRVADSEKALTYVNVGDAMAARGQIDEAIAQYRKAQELDPGNVRVYNNLGLALAGHGQVDEALVLYRKALELKSDYADAHNNLGMALAGRGQLDEAITHYRKALEINPGYAEAHNNFGVALASGRGQLDEAIAHFQKALELKPDYEGARQNLKLALSMRDKQK